MGKIVSFSGLGDNQVGIPLNKITGFSGVDLSGSMAMFKCFIATGAEGEDGGENGWYVTESYSEVFLILEAALNP